MKGRKVLNKVVALILVGVTVFAFAGCSGNDGASDKKNALADNGDEAAAETEVKEELDVIYVMPSTASQYWGEYMLVGAENAAMDIEEKYGVKVNLSTAGPASEAETDAYVQAFENVIAKQPDAIITGTLIPDATAPLVQEATDHGIYVNFMSLGLLDGFEDSYGTIYFCDMGNQGAAAAKAMLKAFKEKGIEPKGKVGVHMSVVVPALEPRMIEFKKYMAENAPQIECLDTLYNENDVNNAQGNAENQISTYGDELIGLFGANNVSGDGLALAIQNAGLSEKMSTVAIDSDNLEIEALANGDIDAIIVQTPYEQAYSAVMSAYEHKFEGKDDEKKVSIDAYTVTQENMEEDQFKALLDPTLLKRN